MRRDAGGGRWLRRTRESILATDFGRHLAIMVGSTAVGHVAVLLTLPLIARLYTPSDFGQLGLFAAFVGTASSITALRYDLMIVAATSRRHAVAIVGATCVFAIPMSLGASGGLAWLIYENRLGFGILPIEAALWMFPSLVATQLFFTLRYWAMRESKFPVIGRATMWQGIVRALAPAALFPLTGGWLGLVAAEVASRLSGLQVIMRESWADLRRGLNELARADIARGLVAYPDSAFAGTPSALINAVANYIPLPLLAGMYGATDAGYFALAQRAIQLPIALVTRNVADVFHARLVREARVSPARARGLFWRTAGALLLMAAVPGLFIAVAARPLVVVALGPEWAPAGTVLVALLPWAMATFVVSPLSRVVLVYRGQGMKLFYDAVSLLALWVVFHLAHSMNWSFTRTVWFLSWSQMATYVIYLTVLIRLLQRELPPSSGGGLNSVAENGA